MPGEANNDLAMISRRRLPPDKIVGDEAIDETDGAVMAKLETLGKFTDRDMIAAGKAFDGEQCLVVLWCDSGSGGGSFAEVQKPAQRIPERSEKFVLTFGQVRVHPAEEGGKTDAPAALQNPAESRRSIARVDIYRITI